MKCSKRPWKSRNKQKNKVVLTRYGHTQIMYHREMSRCASANIKKTNKILSRVCLHKLAYPQVLVQHHVNFLRPNPLPRPYKWFLFVANFDKRGLDFSVRGHRLACVTLIRGHMRVNISKGVNKSSVCVCVCVCMCVLVETEAEIESDRCVCKPTMPPPNQNTHIKRINRHKSMWATWRRNHE